LGYAPPISCPEAADNVPLCSDFTSNQAPKTFKQRWEQDRKASEASGDTKAWNTLFMRPDTVRLASKY